jgi:DNA processing protein
VSRVRHGERSREVLSKNSSRLTTFARTISYPTIAVVGTRKTTQYGREVTKILTEELVSSGFTIVSGLAIGVDAISHKTAIEGGGKTIAVLGCGVDCCYPLSNQHIYNSIVYGNGLAKPDPAPQGCVVSEYPLALRPTRGSFPVRNRIIAGLASGVLVTEGAEDSGALITADYAIKFNRKVFAVPGPITSSLSKGPYKLIAKGAKLVTSAKDILDELGVQEKSIKGGKSIKSIKGGNKEEDMILKILQNEPLHFDELVRRSGFESAKTGSILSVMEIKGLVKGLESGQFSIAS